MRLFLLACLVSGAILAQSPELVQKAHRANAAMAAGRFADAVPLYNELVQAVPNNAGLLLNLGMAQHMSGDDRAAAETLQRALKLDPKLMPAKLFLGASQLALGRPEQAVGPLQSFVMAQPEHVQARQVLAEALLLSGKPGQAEQHYVKLTALDPNNSTGWYGLGRSYEALAEKALEQLTRIAPESPQLLVLAGDSRLKSRQYGAAFLFYKQALEKGPAIRGLHSALAEVYQRTDHLDWAKSAQEKEAVLGEPDCGKEKLACDFAAGRLRAVADSKEQTPEALYWKISAYNELAAGAFAKLLALPASPEAHELRAQIHRNQRRFQEAVAELQQAAKLSPGNRRITRSLAETLHRASEFERARTVLESLLIAEPDAPGLHYLLGDTYLNLQQPQKAIAHLQRAVQLDPSVLAAQAALGRAYLQNNQAQKAIPHLQQALSIDQDGAVHYQLASAYRSTGDSDAARETLRKYGEIAKADKAAKAAVEEQAQITAP